MSDECRVLTTVLVHSKGSWAVGCRRDDVAGLGCGHCTGREEFWKPEGHDGGRPEHHYPPKHQVTWAGTPGPSQAFQQPPHQGSPLGLAPDPVHREGAAWP